MWRRSQHLLVGPINGSNHSKTNIEYLPSNLISTCKWSYKRRKSNYHISDVFDLIWSLSVPLPNPGHHCYGVGVPFCCFLLCSFLVVIFCLLLRVTGRCGTTIWRGRRMVIWCVQVYRVHRGVILFSLRTCFVFLFETGYCEGPAVLSRSVTRECIILSHTHTSHF